MRTCSFSTNGSFVVKKAACSETPRCRVFLWEHAYNSDSIHVKWYLHTSLTKDLSSSPPQTAYPAQPQFLRLLLIPVPIRHSRNISTLLLPALRQLQQIRQVRRRPIISWEDIVDVLLIAIIIQLAPALRLARHLFLDFRDVVGRAVRLFEGERGVEEGYALGGGNVSIACLREKRKSLEGGRWEEGKQGDIPLL
jgi:hypothetical protein